MRRGSVTYCFQAAVWAGMMIVALPVSAQEASTPLILILNSYDRSTAPYARARDVFTLELNRGYKAPLAYRQFDLEKRNDNQKRHDELNVRMLEFTFRESPPDLVIAMGPPALSFWLAHRDSIAAKAPVLVAAAEFAIDADQLRPDDRAVLTKFSFADPVADILALRPDTSNIVMVFGASDHERRLAGMAEMQLRQYSDRFSIEFTSDMAVGALQRRLSTMPKNSAVYYGVFNSDVNGLYLDNYSGLTLVRRSATAPVFGAFDDLLGKGIVGGRLIQLDEIGREMALTAQDVLQGTTRQSPRKVIDLSKPTFAWPELQAWEIDAGLLPPGSTVRFKRPGLWDLYAGWILLVAFVVVAQSLLLGAFFLQRQRRRRAERASLNLSRRLITAFEDERRLIARELHDDLSQRLARAAIDANIVASNPGSDAANSVLEDLQPELVSISKDVHDMSYRLHPSLVDDLGVCAALKAECERLRRRTDATIHENICDVRKQVASDTALCLYRIAQEALTNAIKYAEADTIEISLQKDIDALRLDVRDNGIGFDIEHGHPGLGLASMRERAELAGGSLSIRSQPGRGTSVSATLPRNGLSK